MQSTGTEVIELIQQAVQRASSTAAAALQRTATLESETDDWLRKREQGLKELAEHYLPRVDRGTIDSTFVEVRSDLENVLSRRNRELSRIEEVLARELPKLEIGEAQFSTATEDLRAATAELERGHERLAEQLASDATFRSLTDQLLKCRQRLRQFQDRLQEIRSEAKVKLPPYEASTLFQYLWRRQFGRVQQRGNLMTRRWDRWLARLIDYRRASKSYGFLRATPELMEQAVNREEEAADELVQTIETAKRVVADELQLSTLQDRVSEVTTRRDELMETIEARQQACQPLVDERQAIEDSEGRFYQEAIERLTEHFSRTQERVLAERAAQTPQVEDDQIVAELEWAADQIEEARRDVAAAQVERRTAEKHERELTYVLRSLRRSNFDQDSCYFDPPIDVAPRIEDFFAARQDEHELLKRLRNDRKNRPSFGDRAKARVESVFQNPSTQTALQVVAIVAGSVIREAIRPNKR